MPLGFCTSATMWSRGRDISGELMPEADFAGVDRRATGVRGGSEKNRLSERRGAAISSLEIPSPQYGGDRGHLPSSRSPGSRSPASAGYSPQYHPEVDYAKLNSRSPTGKSGIRRAGTLGSGRGGSKKGRWRQRVKWAIRLLMVFLLVYWFGRTAYQLTFFVKAGMMRYWYHPLMKQRPIPCGTDTPPFDELLAPLATAEASKQSRDDWARVMTKTTTRTARSLLGGGTDGAQGGGRRVGPKSSALSAATSRGIVVEDEAGTRGSGWAEVVDVKSLSSTRAFEGMAAPPRKKRFAILTLCDKNAGYICMASAANKRRYADLHGYDFIVSTQVADPSRPAAWSKILEVRKHLPNYDWLLFIDVDTLIMNPTVRLEDVADEKVDQVIAADHNGINSGVWLVKNSEWSMFFLDELWAQEHLVKGPYLFHYEQRAFHHLFQTEPWSKQGSVRGRQQYAGAAAVREHSKIVNQCVFNSLLPWYVSGDFVVHFAGLKGVWECLIFWHYFDVSQEMPGMRVTDEQWAAELGGKDWGKPSQVLGCMKFKTLF